MGVSRKNLRACPAAGREISSAECGAGRISKFACPATCPFNPWRPDAYDDALAISDRLDAKIFQRLKQDADRRGVRLNPPTHPDYKIQDYFVRQIYRERDENGRTFGERWEADGFKGLNNDEQVLFKKLARMRVRAIEVRTALDNTMSEATDLFDPQATVFRIADRSLAAKTGRFAPLLAWMFEMPHY